MATISAVSESKFIGCPITYRVAPASIPAAATFHRVRLAVVISSGGTEAGSFEFSAPVSGTEAVDFDISSAFRAVADRHEYSPTTLTYPSWTAQLKAYDDYLLNGEERHIGPSEDVSVNTKYVGRLTDRERMLYGSASEELPSKWTRKPTTSKEIVFFGLNYFSHTNFSEAPGTTAVEVKDETDKPWNATNTYNTYAITQPADGFEMRFINSLGVHDNVFVNCLSQTEVNITTDHYVIARQETLTQFSRGITAKQNDYEQWKMSSGPLDRAWQQWWLHEPLMAKWAWLNVSGLWLPVHIVPEETTKGIDRAGVSALTVDFTLRFDINGSPFQ